MRGAGKAIDLGCFWAAGYIAVRMDAIVLQLGGGGAETMLSMTVHSVEEADFQCTFGYFEPYLEHHPYSS